MAMIGWVVSIAALLGGLALGQDRPFAGATAIAAGLLATAFLSFPPIWTQRPLGIGAGPRVAACLAMLLMLPPLLLRS